MHLNIFVSQKCFFYCKGCYSFSREEAFDNIIPTEKIIDFLKFAYNQGIYKVTLCGGDPLTRCDIIELLEQIKAIGFSISLDTVGTSIVRDVILYNYLIIKKTNVAKLSKFVDMIGIPIDGSTNEIFTKFRQAHNDIVNEQLKICNELHKYGVNICINTVVHKGNLTDAIDLARLIKKLDYIKKWQIFQFIPSGKYASKNKDLFNITIDEFLKFQDDVVKEFDGDISKLQFKSLSSRNKAYMLIDNSGNAWIPSTEYVISNNFMHNLNNRVIIGNINNKEDWSYICSHLDKKMK